MKKHKETKSRLAPLTIRKHFPMVKTIIDSRVPVAISVKICDTNGAKRLSPTDCVMAKAIKRTFHADGAIVGRQYTYVPKGSRAIRFLTPVTTRRQILRFDNKKQFIVGTLGLSPVPASKRLGTPTKPRKSGPSGKHYHHTVSVHKILVRTIV